MPWWKVSTETTAAAKPSSARFGAVMGEPLPSWFAPAAPPTGRDERCWRRQCMPMRRRHGDERVGTRSGAWWSWTGLGASPTGSASASRGCGGGCADRTTTARWWRSGSTVASSPSSSPTGPTRPGRVAESAGARSRGRRRVVNSARSLGSLSAPTISFWRARCRANGTSGASACASSSCGWKRSRCCGSTTARSSRRGSWTRRRSWPSAICRRSSARIWPNAHPDDPRPPAGD